ncbi:SAM-dependent methyltransferase [Streptomyces sp. NPDC049906]|uniref:SAM-dependent methyltransferase n=1 Tax=Streptomyces sp. NPDC049906 TaxID=3155656 RepID=UPI00343A981E
MTQSAADATAFTPEWLALREPADAVARSAALLGSLGAWLARRPAPGGRLVVHDPACATGAMARWLAPRLSGAQHWVVHDADASFARLALDRMPPAAADGSPVTAACREGGLAELTASALAGASLVTSSTSLDLLTGEEVAALATACAGAECPALLPLSAVGRVDLRPARPADAEVTEAFNAGQRSRGLLGPDAVAVATEEFGSRGMAVCTHASPWRLRPAAELTGAWLRGWVGGAQAHRPDRASAWDDYLTHRLDDSVTGALWVTVHHVDILALPAGRAAG